MARYPLNLPAKLKQEAEQWAANQGVSLNQFILWSVAEKVGTLKQGLDDPAFPRVTYRRGAAGQPVPVLRGTGIRIQTAVVAAQRWDLTPDQIAAEYGLTEAQVKEALAFYEAHRPEIDADLAVEQAMETAVSRPRLHLDADTSIKALLSTLVERGHDVTRTPNDWITPDASDEAQLLAATAQGRYIFTFNVRDFVVLARSYPRHGGIVLAAQASWTLSELIMALDRLLSETEAEEWIGQVRWLNAWRQ